MDFFSREDKWEITISFLVFFVAIPWVIISYVRKWLAEID